MNTGEENVKEGDMKNAERRSNAMLRRVDKEVGVGLEALIYTHIRTGLIDKMKIKKNRPTCKFIIYNI